jgi:hypothetical protein
MPLEKPKALKDSPLHAKVKEEALQPRTLEEALIALDQMLNDDVRAFLSVANEKTAVTELHSTLGRYLRNKWGLWQRSELAQHMEQVHGAKHVDDMSSIIIAAYCRRGILTRFQRILTEDELGVCSQEG